MIKIEQENTQGTLAKKVRTLSGKTVLITGASGYIAHALFRLLGGTDCRLVLWSRRGGRDVPKGANIQQFDGDLHDRDAWRQALDDVDVVFHFAAQTSVSVAADDPYADLFANIHPLTQLLETCRAWKLSPTVLFAGTATEVGLTDVQPVGESFRDEPVTIYDVHKLTAELYLKIYSGARYCRGTSLRLTNVYGPGPVSSVPDRGVLNTMIRKALRGEELVIFGAGNFLRDYIYVDDVARAFVLAASSMEAVNGAHFVVGSGIGCTLADAVRLVAERVAAKIGKPVRVVHVEPPNGQSPIDKRNFVADSSRFEAATGWKALTRLQQGIDLTIESLLAQQCTD